MVVACLALGVALSGTAVAASVALAPGSVGTPQLRNNAVTTAKVRNNAVTTAKVKNGTLLRADFRPGQLPAGAVGPAGPAGPAGAAGPAGPSDAFARFVNGPVAIPAANTTLANLSVPQAGKYVIWAKAYVTATAAGTATCKLVAGTDSDTSLSYAQNAALAFTLSNLVVHEFAAAGSADFQCAATGTLQANWIKIAAIKVGNLTNSG